MAEHITVIFIRDEYDQNFLVAKAEWFKETPACELYDNYGMKVNLDHEHSEGECYHETVMAYNFWDGSNWKSAVIDNDTYTIIDDEAEVAELSTALQNKKFTHETTGIRHFTAGKFHITQSCWQGDWELFVIYQDEQSADTTA